MQSTLWKYTVASLAAALLLIHAACTDNQGEPAAENPALAEPVPAGMVRGEVLETMDAGTYTYVLLDLGDEQRWMAGPKTGVSVGDIIQTEEGTSMGEFTSSSMGRTFDNLYFVGVLGNLSAPTLPPGHPTTSTKAEADAAAIADLAVEPAEAGKNIAWLYANRDSLANQQVTLRGRVVKYNPGILGWNFLHVQDGSGSAASGDNDLIVTTKATTSVGQTVVLTGNIVLDKDFGAGYSYPVLLEDAALTPE